MDEQTLRFVQSWVYKASEDLDAAEVLSQCSPPLLSSATYHCQQCAEKIMKALLAVHGQALRTHDLTALVVELSTYEPQILTLREEAIRLSPFATRFRYPDDLSFDALQPELEIFERAMNDARTIYRLVLNLLPSAVTANFINSNEL